MPVAPNNTLKFLAQSFSVETPGEAPGVYLTKLGLFFKKKSNASSIRVSILEMKNGFPDRNSTLPNSVIVMNSNRINVPATETSAPVETVFEFPQPIFLDATKQYCFAIQSPSPDFTVFGATRGERDLVTNKIVNNNPLTESAFYSESNAEYSELPSQDIKFKLYRAKFDTANVGTAPLRNKENLEYLKLKNVTIIPNMIGYSTDKVCDPYNPTVEKGRFVELYKTGDGGYILVVESNPGQTFAEDDLVMVYRETVVEGTAYRTELLYGAVEVAPVYEYHSILPRMNIEKKSGAEVTFTLQGVVADGDSYTLESANGTPISDSSEKVFYDKPRYMLNRSKEIELLGSSNSSIQIQANLRTTNEYVAPILRLDSSHVALLTNIVNGPIDGDIASANGFNESTRDGLAQAKYVSRIVTLADGMDAEDIKVYVDAYKPKNTEVYVFGKFQNSEDFTNFDTLPWILLEQVTPENVYSDPKNQTDFREFEYQIPEEYKTSDGYFTYSNEDDGVFVRFKKYSIKIVLTTAVDYEFNPPKVTDLRVIALQK